MYLMSQSLVLAGARGKKQKSSVSKLIFRQSLASQIVIKLTFEK